MIVTAVAPLSGPAFGEMPPTVGTGCRTVIATVADAVAVPASTTVSFAVKVPGRP